METPSPEAVTAGGTQLPAADPPVTQMHKAKVRLEARETAYFEGKVLKGTC